MSALNINEDNPNFDEFEDDDEISDESDSRFRDRVSDWQGEDISVSQQEYLQVKNNADIRDYFSKDRQSQVVASQEQFDAQSKNPRLVASKESLREFMKLSENDQVRSGSRNVSSNFERGSQGRETLPSRLHSNNQIVNPSQRHTLATTTTGTQQGFFSSDSRQIRDFSNNLNESQIFSYGPPQNISGS
jgi:hypothetical protein